MVDALNEEVAGSHYRMYKYQPIEFIIDSGLNFIEGNIFKYLCRYKYKNGAEDLKKARHYCEFWIKYVGNKKHVDAKDITIRDFVERNQVQGRGKKNIFVENPKLITLLYRFWDAIRLDGDGHPYSMNAFIEFLNGKIEAEYGDE